MNRVLAGAAVGTLLLVAPTVHVAQAGAARHTPAATQHVVVATGFIPNVLYAPYYAAQDLGYYRQAGLNVDMNYDRVPDLLQEVARGRYTFGLSGGDTVVQARSAHIPVIYVMAQYQKYPIGAMALKSGPGLKSPADLRGKNVGFSGPGGPTYVGLRALLRSGHLKESDIRETNIGFTETQSLIAHQIDVAMTFIDNEPVQARALGYPVQVLPVSKYVSLVSSGVVTSQSVVRDRAPMVQRFVLATLRGLAYCQRHPDRAFAISLKRMPELVDPKQQAIQRQVLKARLLFELKPKGHPYGWSDPKSWVTTVKFLRSIGLAHGNFKPEWLYTDRFANAANING